MTLMGNDVQTKVVDETPKVSRGQRWFAGYIIAGIIWYLGQSFNRTSYDGIIILAIAILCGIFYHRLKEKIKIKQEGVRVVVTFLVLEVIAGALVGFFTALF
jgi:hypothetical protein